MTIFNQTTRRGFLLASVALGVVSLPGLKVRAAEPASGGTATLLISSEPPVLTMVPLPTGRELDMRDTTSVLQRLGDRSLTILPRCAEFAPIQTVW